MMQLAYGIAHYFYPKYSNNHKAKLLHTSSLVLLSLFLIVFQVILQALPVSRMGVLGYAANISTTRVIELTNQKRAESGLPPLQYNAALESAAKAKGEHMLAFDYWAHTAPDGTEPWSFFASAGYKYRYAGENLARDFSNPESAVEAWMASPSHRDNLLSGKYKEIGIAVVEGELAGSDTTLIVQLFGTQLVDTTPDLPIAQAQTQPTAVPTAIPTPYVPTNTPKPTATTVPAIAQVSPTVQITSSVPVAGETQEEAGVFQRVLVSPFDTTKGVSLITIVTLLAVMVVDGVIVKKRNISRIGGRPFAHLAFLGMILALVLIAKAGQIL